MKRFAIQVGTESNWRDCPAVIHELEEKEIRDVAFSIANQSGHTVRVVEITRPFNNEISFQAYVNYVSGTYYSAKDWRIYLQP